MTEHFKFDCNGVPYLLNGYFIELKGIDKATCETLADLHRQKHSLISDMLGCDRSENVKLHELDNLIGEVEYKLQETWGFTQDDNWHRTWLLPHCECSAAANITAYPCHKIISPKCPVHGEL